MSKFIDLNGETYGYLTLLQVDKTKSSNKTYWICKCKCGVKKSIRLDSIRNGRVISCGCYSRGIACRKSTNKKYNKYNILNSHVEIITNSGKIILIDLDDYEKVKEYCWHIDSRGYAKAKVPKVGEYEQVLLHRLIMNAKKGEVVDHINHITYDNRKANLRTCNQFENMANQSISKRNTSGAKGVYWNIEKSKWEVRIGYLNKSIFIGYFTDKSDALIARKNAEIKYFGEFMNAEN